MTAPFDKTIGIIGGGQLGKMLIESSAGWNVKYAVLENDPEAPAVRHANTFVHGKLTDGEKIRELALVSDVLTFEIEHIDAATLFELEQSGKRVIPSASILKIIQDKGLQKQYFKKQQLPTSPFIVVNASNLPEIPAEIIDNTDKVVVKSCREGYDGKGVSIVKKESIAQNGLPFKGNCVIEKFISGAREISIIVARNQQGEMVFYPPAEMVFDPVANLVDYLFTPAELTANQLKTGNEIAGKAISGFNGVGIFAVEFFLDRNGNWYINEIAPRPHNSGHQTIEACYTSQYEQLNRILLGLPLGDPSLIMPAAMVNLVGNNDTHGEYDIAGLEPCLRTPGFYLHLYDKNTIKPNRKMGHYTVMASNTQNAIDKAMELKKHLIFKTKKLI